MVEYDARQRNPELERCRDLFHEVHDGLVRRLIRLDPAQLKRKLNLRALGSSADEPVVLETTLERELCFLASHNVHHVAMMIMLAEKQGVSIPAEFGVAYSTAAYWSTQSPAQSRAQ